jgi:hypothetical protein
MDYPQLNFILARAFILCLCLSSILAALLHRNGLPERARTLTLALLGVNCLAALTLGYLLIRSQPPAALLRLYLFFTIAALVSLFITARLSRRPLPAGFLPAGTILLALSLLAGLALFAMLFRSLAALPVPVP